MVIGEVSTMSDTRTQAYDVVVVGGGAAGLSGALLLGRSRRSVLVIDAGEPRNAPAAGVHNFLSRDGTSPAALLEVGRSEVRGCGGQVWQGWVSAAARDRDGFAVTLDDGRVVGARRLLVTTGLRDELPDVPGVRERWGRDVLHCPYCHGWEVRDQAIGILGSGPMAVHQALLFRQWTSDVTLFVHTAPEPTPAEREQLAAREVSVVEGEVTELVVADDRLTGVRLASGRVVPPPRRRRRLSAWQILRANGEVRMHRGHQLAHIAHVGRAHALIWSRLDDLQSQRLHVLGESFGDRRVWDHVVISAVFNPFQLGARRHSSPISCSSQSLHQMALIGTVVRAHTETSRGARRDDIHRVSTVGNDAVHARVRAQMDALGVQADKRLNNSLQRIHSQVRRAGRVRSLAVEDQLHHTHGQRTAAHHISSRGMQHDRRLDVAQHASLRQQDFSATSLLGGGSHHHHTARKIAVTASYGQGSPKRTCGDDVVAATVAHVGQRVVLGQ